MLDQKLDAMLIQEEYKNSSFRNQVVPLYRQARAGICSIFQDPLSSQ